MEKEFVIYSLALRMKALGYDEPCITFYPVCLTMPYTLKYDSIGINGEHHAIKAGYKNSTINSIWEKRYSRGTSKRVFAHVTAPTWQSAFDWFSENHDLWSNIDRIFKDEYGYTITPGSDEPINVFNIDSYKEAKIDCLTKLIEIVEQKEK